MTFIRYFWQSSMHVWLCHRNCPQAFLFVFDFGGGEWVHVCRRDFSVQCLPWPLFTLSLRQGLLLNPKLTPLASQVSLGSQFVPGILSLPLKCCDYRCAPTSACHLNGYLGSKFYSSCLQACAANVKPLMRQQVSVLRVAQGQEK